jgi:hypothetical protein
MAEVTDTNPKGAGAPEGNQNSSKNNRLWAETIRRALVQSDAERLRRIAEALLTKAEDGDMTAIKELGDRLDGKASQGLVLSGDSNNPIAITEISRTIIDAAKD